MRKILLIYMIILTGIFFSCDDEFLEKYPITAVSPEKFFTSANDFKLYMNQFYPDLGGFPDWQVGYFNTDIGTDNQIGNDPSTWLNGQGVQSVSDNDWNYNFSKIRNLNIMLNKTGNASWNEIKGYVGEGRFFRAWFYFKLLKKFGGVPWVNKEISLDDTESLEAPRLQRNVIADSIIADLDFAIANLPLKAQTEKFRVSKEAALAFKARVCLYEGTWEKYHGKKGTPFKVDGSDGTKYLEMAMNAAKEIIDGGKFSIDKKGSETYNSLFNSEDFTASTEVILWRQKIRGMGSQNVTQMMRFGLSWGLTSDLINSYLCLDGLPASLSALPLNDYSLSEVVINRDPRLAQTIFYPGVALNINDKGSGTVTPFANVELLKVRSGYMQRKGFSPLESNLQNNQCQLAYIYFRYGEVLLNYIEAKAELAESGKTTLNQNDFDISINKLRARVNMPDFQYSTPIIDNSDPMSGILPWYLVEIRRERRIELAVEGYRIDDIFRWAAADMLIKGRLFRGAPFQYYIDNNLFTTSQIQFVDDDGILSPWFNTEIDNQGGYAFNLNRDYLYSIPLQEISLAGYTNNPGWE